MQLITHKTKLVKPSPKPAPASAYVLPSTKKEKKPKPTRQEKALGLVGSVLRSEQSSSPNDSIYFVQSQSHADKVYEVHSIGHKFGCDCADFLCRNVESCKHIIAVTLFIEGEEWK
jgi:hypothetical protein